MPFRRKFYVSDNFGYNSSFCDVIHSWTTSCMHAIIMKTKFCIIIDLIFVTCI